MALDKELNATYEKISTLHLLHAYKHRDYHAPNQCEVCGKTWDLNDKVYKHVNLDGQHYVNGVCENCVRKHRVMEQL